ncbi:MAG TPA: VOC family protein [Caulobacteraceae bacterium]|nr:VOC family protein [Caulobacteraceae bacterium]
MAKVENKVFDVRGINHLALVCKDMARTVDFYQNVLGMPLVKTLDLPHGMGQHFFFDIGNGDCLAFFWFPDAPEAQPGVASAANLPTVGPITSAHGSMNHVAFNVPEDRFDEYCAKLKALGIRVTPVLNHDDSETQTSIDKVTPTTFVRSIYFFDPDGVCLEFACWTRVLDPECDATIAPVGADGNKRERTPRLEPAG